MSASNVSISDIPAGIAAAKSVFDLAKTFLSLKSDVEKNNAIRDIAMKSAEASMALVGAQAEMSALRQMNADLTEENRKLRQFAADKDQYILKRFYPDTFVYVAKEAVSEGDMAGYFCATCFDQSQRSRLVVTTEQHHRNRIFLCQSCKGKFLIGGPYEE